METLPTVSEQVCAAVRQELVASAGNDYVSRILERLKAENPCLADFVAAYALRQKEPVVVATAAVLTFRLLESQLEADRMNREFGGHDAGGSAAGPDRSSRLPEGGGG